ncbi:MAG: hypothetical protein FJ125_11900 [Deltaproteobacteria bacterium]|nr:hypothetical protein [Deltaproteobacteria bacterium]
MQPIQQREELIRALEQLSEDDRAVLVLHELEGLSGGIREAWSRLPPPAPAGCGAMGRL